MRKHRRLRAAAGGSPLAGHRSRRREGGCAAGEAGETRANESRNNDAARQVGACASEVRHRTVTMPVRACARVLSAIE